MRKSEWRKLFELCYREGWLATGKNGEDILNERGQRAVKNGDLPEDVLQQIEAGRRRRVRM